MRRNRSAAAPRHLAINLHLCLVPADSLCDPRRTSTFPCSFSPRVHAMHSSMASTSLSPHGHPSTVHLLSGVMFHSLRHKISIPGGDEVAPWVDSKPLGCFGSCFHTLEALDLLNRNASTLQDRNWPARGRSSSWLPNAQKIERPAIAPFSRCGHLRTDAGGR